MLDLPSTYLLPAHLSSTAFHDLEKQIPTLTSDITEAKLVLGKVTTKQRVLFELRSRKLWTEEVPPAEIKYASTGVLEYAGDGYPPRKRRKKDDANCQSNSRKEHDADEENQSLIQALPLSRESAQSQDDKTSQMPGSTSPNSMESFHSALTSLEPPPDIECKETIKVVKLDWFMECTAVGHLLPLEPYLVYEGRPVTSPRAASAEPKVTKFTKRPYIGEQIFSRVKDDDAPRSVINKRNRPYHIGGYHIQEGISHPIHLLRQTTSEHDSPEKLPPVPDYLHTTYSCQRPTPIDPPNGPFIEQLKKIRTARILIGDEIGVRAYSTAVASLAAYPYLLTSTQEVLNLPGCDQKIGFLYQEWKEAGQIPAVDDISSDPKLRVLSLFYEIWGVGATTARDFYNRGWRDLDDIVEYGWSTLTRVQQIGVKFYDEFQIKIPRNEVESIASTILSCANKIHPGFHMCIVGGYRRGKRHSGDVDVVLSHPDEVCTFGFIQDIVEELEKDNWITHTLLLSLANSERGQTPVGWKGEGRKKSSGFDTLDKALLVWQDPDWLSRTQDLEENPRARNPSIHRRVDIIISPWKTVGCAVAGWTSGTTFQRDLRRYAKKVKNMKFDSSGIRDRADGHWIDLESIGGKALDMLTAEKRVFAGMDLEWREPNERCTG